MHRMNKLFLFLLLLPFTACTEGVIEDKKTDTVTIQEPLVKAVDVDGFEKAMQQKNVLILDVRTDGEVAQGVIPGAVQMDFMNRAEFENGVASLDKNKQILVYCKVGGRSAKAAEYLKGKGFLSVYDLRGGFDAWSAAGKQTETIQK